MPEGVTGRVILGFIALLFEAVFICAIIKDFRESLDVGITSGEYFEMLMEDPFLPTFIGLLVLFGIVGGGLLINAVNVPINVLKQSSAGRSTGSDRSDSR